MLNLALIMCLTIGGMVHDPAPAASGTADVTDTVKEVFRVGPSGSAVIDVDNGNISVETIRVNEVRIEIERTVSVSSASEAQRLLERHSYSFDRRGDDVHISSQLDSEGGLWGRRGRERVRVRVRVQVPESFDVRFKAGAGNINVGSVGGNVDGRTGAGNIKIGSVRGDLHLDTGSGNVEVSGAQGLIRVSTGAGNVTLENARGSVNVSSGAGNITAYITEQPRETSVLETGAGNVTVHLARAARARVEGSARMGNASTDFPLTVEGKWMSKSFAGELNGGGPAIRMRAGVGNVTLRRL
jgi:Ca2+-binding RTX toxin-like protein